MKLAQRMVGIGTETAFEAAARAARWRRQGRTSSTWRSASPTSTRRPTSARRPSSALDDGLDALRPAARPARAARGDRRATSTRAAASRSTRPTSSSRPAPSRSCSSRSSRWSSAGDEVIYPNPGFPIYESMIRFVGAHAGAAPAARGERLPLRPRRAARAGHAADQADHLQLAAQPDRRRPDPRGHRRAIADIARERDIIVLADEIYGRDPLRGRARLDRRRCPAWPSGRSSSTASPRPTR